MYLLIENKLYCKQDDVYKSVDIINGELIFNGIESKPNTINGILLTYSEVYAKFNINPAMPHLGKDYNFPRKPVESKEDTVEVDTKKPLKTEKSSK